MSSSATVQNPLKRPLLVYFGICAMVAAVIVFRWPRLKPDMVSITRSEVRGDTMLVEYRMSQPFAVAIGHSVCKSIQPSNEPGVHVTTPSTLRKDNPKFVASAHDLLRGEYYVRLRFERGTSLTIDGNGQHFELNAWSAPDATGVTWHPQHAGAMFGNGNGHDAAYFPTAADQEEYLRIRAGTDVTSADREGRRRAQRPTRLMRPTGSDG